MTVPATVEERIEDALMERVASIPGDYPTAWLNDVYPERGVGHEDTFLAISHSPLAPERLFVGSDDEHMYRGILGIGVLSPLGEGTPTGVAGVVAAHFPTDLRLVCGTTVVRVVSAPTVGGGYVDSVVGRWRTPVTVEYRTISV